VLGTSEKGVAALAREIAVTHYLCCS